MKKLFEALPEGIKRILLVLWSIPVIIGFIAGADEYKDKLEHAFWYSVFFPLFIGHLFSLSFG